MSRSRKKHGIIKDRGWMRELYNRKFRRVNKQRIKMGKEPIPMKSLIDSYDVHDWIFHWRFVRELWKEDEDLKRKYFNK